MCIKSYEMLGSYVSVMHYLRPTDWTPYLSAVQVLLSVLGAEQRGGHVIRRLQQEVQKQANKANHDVTPITMALMAGFQHSKAAHNLSSMLSRLAINLRDQLAIGMTHLFLYYGPYEISIDI